MDQIQVNIVKPQLVKRYLKCFFGILIPGVLNPELYQDMMSEIADGYYQEMEKLQPPYSFKEVNRYITTQSEPA